MQQQRSQNEGGPGIAAVIVGVAAVAACCFGGLLLAGGAGAAGLGALTHSWRYILPIVAAVLVIVGVLSYRRWKSVSSGH